MYRPTVRMSDVYKDYLDSLSDVTGLDRNQLIRLALFSAPFSNLFIAQVKEKAGDVPLPHPDWEAFDHGIWMEQNPKVNKGGDDVNVINGGTAETKIDNGNTESIKQSGIKHRRQQSEQGREREIRKRESGGITIRIS